MRVPRFMACAALTLLPRLTSASLIASPPSLEIAEAESPASPERVPAWLRPGDEVRDRDDDDDPRVIVVSTGTRTERDAATSPIATEVVTREEIVGSGAENLAEALEESGASIQTSTSFNGTSLRLRGLDPEQVLIVVDGQRVTGRIGGAIDLRRFTIENVERIEIVKGAGSVLYGADALAGVVNIVTRPPEPGVQAEAHGAYGSRNTLDLSGRVAGGGRRWGLAAFGGYHATDGWDDDPSDLTTTGDAIGQWNLGASAQLQAPSRLRWTLSGDYLERDARGVTETATGAVLDRRNLTQTSNATAQVDWRGPDSRLLASVHHNYFRDQFRQDQRGDTALDQYQPTDDHVGQVQLQYDQSAGRHVVTTGLDAQAEWLTTTRIVSNPALGTGDSSVDRQRLAMFVQDEWTPSQAPRISLLPAVRVDFDTVFGIYPTGRLAMLVAPHEDLAMRVSYGRGYRAPSFREMYLAFSNAGVGYRVAGNPVLQPEQAWTLDLGATWTPREWLHVGASVFDNRLRDLITTDLVSSGGVGELDVFGSGIVGSAYTRGLEANAGVEFLEHFALTGSYTLLDARDQQTGLRLPGRATHQGTASAEFHQRRWGTRLFARVGAVGPQAFTTGADGSQTLAKPYASVDLRLSQSFLRYVTAFAGIENLLDAGEQTLLPLPPRSFYGGLTVRY
jgi:outer membrane receptor for ferrienterochelin and colicins